MTPDEVQIVHDAILTLMDELGHRKAADWFVINEALIVLAKRSAKSEPAKWGRDVDTGFKRVP